MLLEGTRVLEWGQIHAAPVCGTILGAMGADVIKIEEPVSGDGGRHVDKVQGTPARLPGGSSTYFEVMNRNKRSVTINLKEAAGREVLYRLVEKSDVFVHNYRQKAAVKLGLDYGTLSQYNPKLVYAIATGLGLKGPDRDKAAYDQVAQARAGIMWSTGEPGMRPFDIVAGVGDRVAAMLLSLGIVAALFGRDRVGGQQLDVSLLGGHMFLGMEQQLTQLLWLGHEVSRQSRKKVPNPLYNIYECQDGKWLFAVHAINPDRYWPEFCRALGIEELEKDPRFENGGKRDENAEELISIIDWRFAQKTRDEWMQILGTTDLIFESVNTVADLARDPQAIENGYITDFNHPVLGPVKIMGFPISFSKSPAATRTSAPQLGQHTEEVLLEVGGYSWDDIARLKEQGVV